MVWNPLSSRQSSPSLSSSQASQVLCTLLRSSGPDELEAFAPLTRELLPALGAAMAACESDEALLWLLETMREASCLFVSIWNERPKSLFRSGRAARTPKTPLDETTPLL